MSKFFTQFKSTSIRPCRRIRHTSTGSHHRIKCFDLIFLMCIVTIPSHTGHFCTVTYDFLHFGIQTDTHFFSVQFIRQYTDYVGSMIRLWKHAISTFNFHLQSKSCKIIHQCMIIKSINCTVKEFCIFHDRCKQIFGITGIGQVTPSFTGNINLFTQFFILFKQRHTMPVSCCDTRCHHSSGTAADYCHFAHPFSPLLFVSFLTSHNIILIFCRFYFSIPESSRSTLSTFPYRIFI